MWSDLISEVLGDVAILVGISFFSFVIRLQIGVLCVTFCFVWCNVNDFFVVRVRINAYKVLSLFLHYLLAIIQCSNNSNNKFVIIVLCYLRYETKFKFILIFSKFENYVNDLYKLN